MISPGLNLRHLHRQHVSIDSERQASLQVSASRTTHSGHMPLPVWHLSSRVDRSHFHDADGRYMPLEMLRLTVGLTADGVDRLDCKPPAAQVTRCSSQCGNEKGAGQPDLPNSRACLNSRRPMPERRNTRRHSASSSSVRRLHATLLPDQPQHAMQMYQPCMFRQHDTPKEGEPSETRTPGFHIQYAWSWCSLAC